MQKVVEKKDESDALIRLAVETTLKSEPDTRRQFIEAVQNAGEKQFVLEIAILVPTAATMINTLYAKGKAREITEEEFKDKDGNKTKRRVNIEYASNGPLAGLLSKIWPAGTLA